MKYLVELLLLILGRVAVKRKVAISKRRGGKRTDVLVVESNHYIEQEIQA